MRKLINFFKKKSETVLPDIQKPKDYWDINGKRFAIAESMIVSSQVIDETRRVYGWTLEVKTQWVNSAGEIHTTNWHTYYGNRIYQSQGSAIKAMLDVNKYGYYVDVRVMPLYIMENAEFRDYKIDKLLMNEPTKKVFEIKAWKVKEDRDVLVKGYLNPQKYKKGTIFIQNSNGTLQKAATRNEKTRRVYKGELEDLLKEGLLEEFDITNEKWIHPHLCKELKIKIKGENKI